MLIFGERHLRAVITGYVDHYNYARPYRGLGLDTPVPSHSAVARGPVIRHPRLGGLINESLAPRRLTAPSRSPSAPLGSPTITIMRGRGIERPGTTAGGHALDRKNS